MVDCAFVCNKRTDGKTSGNACCTGKIVGARLGGVFLRCSNTCTYNFGDHRFFNNTYTKAFIIGSTVGMSVCGLKPIVEVQFAD